MANVRMTDLLHPKANASAIVKATYFFVYCVLVVTAYYFTRAVVADKPVSQAFFGSFFLGLTYGAVVTPFFVLIRILARKIQGERPYEKSIEIILEMGSTTGIEVCFEFLSSNRREFYDVNCDLENGTVSAKRYDSVAGHQCIEIYAVNSEPDHVVLTITVYNESRFNFANSKRNQNTAANVGNEILRMAKETKK